MIELSLTLLYSFSTIIVYVPFFYLFTYTRPYKLHSLSTYRVQMKVLLTYLTSCQSHTNLQTFSRIVSNCEAAI